jgi:hypothetical protein
MNERGVHYFNRRLALVVVLNLFIAYALVQRIANAATLLAAIVVLGTLEVIFIAAPLRRSRR